MPRLTRSLRILQVKGKGTFVPCTLEVTDQNIFVTSGRGGPEDRSAASVQGVLIGAPKKARKNHPHVFRVDLAWPDSKGTPKYIFACSTVKERDDWVKLFTQHPSAGKTNGKNQKVPKAFDAKEVAAMEMRSTAMQAGATADVEVPPSSGLVTRNSSGLSRCTNPNLGAARTSDVTSGRGGGLHRRLHERGLRPGMPSG
eukprot:SAG25_NODE_89_length_16305_cov_24.431630_4_plen_199_part_00